MIHKYAILFFSLAAGFCTRLNAQNTTLTKAKKQEFTISSFDSVVVFDVLSESDKKVGIKNDRRYYWYYANTILSTLGGADGKLLHGCYRSFYINKNLKETGEFYFGLKTGEWKKWFDNGNLKELITWKNGLKNGTYSIFNLRGELIERGNFENNLKHGNIITYKDSKVESIVKYRDGKIKESKIKTVNDKNKNEGNLKKISFISMLKLNKQSTEKVLEAEFSKKENFFLRFKSIFKKIEKVDKEHNISFK